MWKKKSKNNKMGKGNNRILQLNNTLKMRGKSPLAQNKDLLKTPTQPRYIGRTRTPKDKVNVKKNIAIFNDPVQINLRNKVLNNQITEVSKNEKIIDNAEQDLTSLRRQIEISENSSMRKANHLFLLKTLLSFLSLLFIPVLLKKQSIITETNFKYSVYIISALFIFIVLFNVRSFWKRNNNRYSMRNFTTNVKTPEVSTIPKLTCIGKKKESKTPEELEIDRKLKILKSLETKFSRINPSLNMVDKQNKTTSDEMNAIKKEFRDVFGSDLSDRAIDIAVSKRIETKGNYLFT